MSSDRGGDVFKHIFFFVRIQGQSVKYFIVTLKFQCFLFDPITKTSLFKYIENFTNKNGNFSDKNSDIFHISAQNIVYGYSLEPPRRGGSNEYPQSMFLSGNKENNVYPCKPQFYYIQVGFKGVKIIQVCFHDGVFDPNPIWSYSLLWNHANST